MIPNTCTDEVVLNLFKALFGIGLSLNEFKTINFSDFSEIAKQEFMKHIMPHKNKAVCFLLDFLKTVNFGKYGNENPLQYYSGQKNFDMVKLLIEKYKADIDYANIDGKTAIMLCAESGSTEMVEYLYKQGAKIDIDSNRKQNNHIYACGKPDVVNLIKKLEAEKQQQLEHNKPHSLLRLINSKHIEKAKAILNLDFTKLDNEVSQGSGTL